MATEVGHDILVLSIEMITWEELVGIKVRELDILSDEKCQAVTNTWADTVDEGISMRGRGGGCIEFCLLHGTNRHSK